MINGGYLIPANTKKGQLIFGVFNPPDLILLSIGVSLSIILLLIVGTDSTLGGIICLIPGLICGFLVMPIPNYTNVRTFFRSMISFYNSQRQYRWRGWCLYERKK